MRKIITLLLLLPVFCNAQYIQQVGANKTTDTTWVKGVFQVRQLGTSDTNIVIGLDARGNFVHRIKGGGLDGDSLQTVIGRGKNSTIGVRFGSGANVGSMRVDSNNITHYANGAIDFEISQNAIYLYNGGGSFYNRIQANAPSANRFTAFQDKTGTVALLSDFTDTIASRVATKSDTVWGAGSLRLVTESDMNTVGATRVNLNGNTVGSTMVYGVIDSYNRVEQNFNTYDTVYARGLHSFNGKWSEVVASFYNNNTTTGVRQTNSINLVCGTGTVSQSNTPAITFGVPNSSTSPRISSDGLIGYSVLNLYSTTLAGSIIKPAFQGANTGDALTLALGSYTIANNSPTASGIMSMFKVGTGYLNTGRWTPSSGSTTLNMLIGAVYVGATGTYTGNVVWATDDSVNLVGLGSGGTYFGYRATKNSGWGFYQTGSSAKNAFVGRSLFGTTTDNGADAVQVVGDLNLTTAGNKLKIATGSNASAGTGTLSSGTVTINTTAVTASSLIFITATSAPSGYIYVASKVAGTSFTVTSTGGSDNSTFNWLIIN